MPTLNVTLVSGGKLTISPSTIDLSTKDTLYLNVSCGSITPNNLTFDYSFDFGGVLSPLSNSAGSNESLDTNIEVGTEDYTKSEEVSYTLSITYNGTTYSDDPKMKINPQG